MKEGSRNKQKYKLSQSSEDTAEADSTVDEELVETLTGLQALQTPEGVLSFSSGVVYGTGLV